MIRLLSEADVAQSSNAFRSARTVWQQRLTAKSQRGESSAPGRVGAGPQTAASGREHRQVAGDPDEVDGWMGLPITRDLWWIAGRTITAFALNVMIQNMMEIYWII